MLGTGPSGVMYVIWSIVSGSLMRFSFASGRVLRSSTRTERDNRSQGCGQGRESKVRMYQGGRGDDENEKCGWSILPVCLGTAERNTRRCAENRFAMRYPETVHDSAGPTCTTVTVETGRLRGDRSVSLTLCTLCKLVHSSA